MHKTRPFIVCLAGLVALAGLSACETTDDYAQDAGEFAQDAGEFAYEAGKTVVRTFENPRPWPNERRILARDWVVPQVESADESVYCYRTLGKVDCHGEPLSEAERGRFMAPAHGAPKPAGK